MTDLSRRDFLAATGAVGLRHQGQRMRFIVTTEYEDHCKPTLVTKSQLEEIGLKGPSMRF